MSRIVYVNGQYLPYNDAAIHVEDRGFQFADSVYEVMEIKNGYIIDESGHLQRLVRSLGELQMQLPMDLRSLANVIRQTIRKNRIRCGAVYTQITRGAARRDFVFPHTGVKPTLVCIARAWSHEAIEALANIGINVITMPDNRWDRPDIKTTGLLPNVLARQAAKQAGAREAWLVDQNGYVTEGAASNVWIVDQHGTLKTRPAEQGILRGITRETVLRIAKNDDIEVRETPFTVEEALAASEAFVTAATALVMPVIRINDQNIGNGTPGPLAKKLRKIFHQHAECTN